MKLSLLILIIFFLGSCTSSQRMVPSSNKIKKLRLLIKDRSFHNYDDLNSYEKQAYSYLKADSINSDSISCEEFLNLSKDSSFPLNQLALINSLPHCSWKRDHLENWWSEHDQSFTGYLRRHYLETSLSLAKKIDSSRYISLFSRDLAKLKRIRKEKETLLKESLKAAIKTQDKIFINEMKYALYQQSPRLNLYLKKENFYSAARDFERNREFTQARRLYRQIVNDENRSLNLRKKSYERYCMTYKLQRRKNQYVKHLGYMSKWLKRVFKKNPLAKDLWLLTKIKYARALWSNQKLLSARSQLKQIINIKDLKPQIRAKSFWILAAMHLEQKEYTKAIEKLEIVIKEKNLSSKFSDKALWSLGWNYYLLKQHTLSAETFQKAKNQTADLFQKRKFIFWEARSYQKKGEAEKANILLEELLNEDPYGYYGIISAMELKKELPKIRPSLLLNKNYQNRPTLDWLIALKEEKIAEDYLKEKGQKIKDIEDVLSFLPYYKKSGWHEGGILKYFTIKSEKRDRILKNYISIVYPTPYQEDIKEMGGKFNIPPELIYSISRQESAFNPSARSWADAFGLMQLLPEKAKILSKRADVSYNDFTDLYHVPTNIALGSLHLRDMINKYKGNFIAFVASYNAGPGAVNRWLKHRYKKDPIEFIEMIPYEETKGYVKLVFRNLVTYKRLLGEDVLLDKDFLWNSKL